ncbi:biotin/lipoate A/B protein ligase family protein [Natrialbaceae archaeon A-CW1-1]
MVRRIDVSGETVGYWNAMDELMAKQFHKGMFEPTLVVMHWDSDQPCLDIGTHEDADRIDFDHAREQGFAVGRRYAFAGGTAVHTPDFPNFMLYYRKPDTTILAEADESGLATVSGLESIGFSANYDSIGDVEIVKDDARVKVMAGSAATIHHPDLWVATMSIIWDFPPEGSILDDAVSIPEEKFQDKDTDSLTGRMQSLSSVLEELNIGVGKTTVLDAITEANVEALLGPDEPIVESEWSNDERAFLETVAPFFESDPWRNRVSTARMCRNVPPDTRLGQAAYKSRKLINVSVVLDDDDCILDAIIGGDLYIRPHPTVTAGGALETIVEAVRGLEATDEDALEESIASVLDRPGTEAPGISVEDFVAPIVRATENTQTVERYLESQ